MRVTLQSSDMLPIHSNSRSQILRSLPRQEAQRVPIVERPRRNDSDAGEKRAGAEEVHRQPDILADEADEEGDSLRR